MRKAFPSFLRLFQFSGVLNFSAFRILTIGLFGGERGQTHKVVTDASRCMFVGGGGGGGGGILSPAEIFEIYDLEMAFPPTSATFYTNSHMEPDRIPH